MTLFADTLPVDHDVRERVRTDLDRNLFVEAGAGTGKTRVLVDRVVRLVAITFTEAAAAELRDRIRSELEKAAADHLLLDDEQRRCAIARANIDRATITTLHGFAQRILAEHPLDVGLAPLFDVEDEVQARVRFVERWMHFRDELFDDDTAAGDLLVLHALGFTTDRLREVARLLHQRWDALVGVDFPVPSRPAIDVASISEPIREAVAVAEPHWPREGDRLIQLVDEWAALLAALDGAAVAGDELEAVRALVPKVWGPSNQGRAEHWGAEKKTILALLTTANERRQALLEQLRTRVLQRFMPRLQQFTLAGVEERRQNGRLEFHDLLVHARDVLRTNQEVRVAMAGRIDVILIDEFQDTDPLQLDIAFALAADDPALPPPPWPEAVLRPGKILVVGDPKQSIYRFRGADISLWDRTKRLFPDGVEQLGQNFRTVPPLLEWVNRVFRTVIAEGEEGAQPAYHDLSAFRPEVREGPAVVVVGEQHADTTAAELREREASDLARLIVAMKVNGWEVEDVDAGGCRPARFDDIAILVPTRTPLAQLERALDANDVPYRVESRSLVWATDAVRELLAVLGAIDDPADDIAVVAALRSPGFACSDIDLVEWKVAGGRWDYHRSERPEGINEGHPVAAGMAALSAYHRLRADLPVDRLVELVMRERRHIELTFALRRPRDHWRRLRFVLDQARAFVEAGGASLGDFAAWAQLQSDEGAMVIETPAPERDDDAVRILTIHGSKGLEFPIVVLAGLSSAGRDTGPWVLHGADGPEVAIGAKDARFATPGFAALQAQAGDADMHEGHRLLYVAATRARDHLVVGLHHNERGNTPARELWKVCQDSAAGWWNPAELGDQLALPVEIPTAEFQALTADDRRVWIAEHAELLAKVNERRVFAATAIAALHDVAEPIDPVVADDESPASLPPAIRRGGTALGRAVHAVLATADFDAPGDLTALAAVQAAAEGIADVADVERRAQSALRSPTVAVARAAGRRWRELYVAAPVGERGRLIEGYIDLLYEDANGELVVVDYKTDADLETAPDRYRLQAATYALALETTLGRPVARAVFVFCRPDGAIEREVADLPAAIGEVRVLVD